MTDHDFWQPFASNWMKSLPLVSPIAYLIRDLINNSKLNLFLFCCCCYFQKPETPLSSIIPTSAPVISSSTLAPLATSTLISQTHNTARDEIYIDDEGIEGSGSRGEVSVFHLLFSISWNLLKNLNIPDANIVKRQER